MTAGMKNNSIVITIYKIFFKYNFYNTRQLPEAAVDQSSVRERMNNNKIHPNVKLRTRKNTTIKSIRSTHGSMKNTNVQKR